MISQLKTNILALAVTLSGYSAFGLVEPLGFKDWKTTRVTEAKAALDKVQTELDPNLPVGRAQPQSQALKLRGRVQKVKTDSRLTQAQTNLEIAQELSAHDYFVLYLSQLKTETEVQEAVKKLDPAEVADIMMGIKKQLNSNSASDPTGPTVSPTPGQKTSLLGF